LVVTVSFPVPEAEHVAYTMAKKADDQLALAAAVQLRAHGVASLGLHPGLVRTEGVMQFAEHLDLTDSQSMEGVGRAVVALADDVELMTLSGSVVSVEQLAERYGIDVMS
jgi:NAD(P)-dependent dehydrogenase (short-subunit alcohol dehydrogenase family)